MFLLLLSLTVLKDNFVFYYFFTSQILGAMAADLLYKSMPGLCLIISGVARYLPKPALNNIPSLCVYYDLYGINTEKEREMMSSEKTYFVKES